MNRPLMEKHVRVVAFGCIALGALLALSATYWGAKAAVWLISAALTLLAAGWGLLRLKRWAPLLVMVLAAVALLAFPVGTVLGGYALWVMFSDSTNKLFLPEHVEDTSVAGVEWVSGRILTTTLEWGPWRILKTLLAVAHSAAVLVAAIGLMTLYAAPGPQGPHLGLGFVMPFLAFALLGLPWSIPLYVLTEMGSWKPHLWVVWTLLILTDVLNTGLLWFWALRRKRHMREAGVRI